MMELKNMTVGEIVNQVPVSATVFKKYNIDFCCKGKRPFMEACDTAGLDADTLLNEIANVSFTPHTNLRTSSWSVPVLCDFIVNNHHQYVKSVLPELKALALKVANVHGQNHPELVEVYDKFLVLAAEMELHMEKEETELFPKLKESGEKIKDASLLGELEDEHEVAGGLMEEIRHLTSDFTPPEEACTSYRVLFQLLNEFEDDLHQHVHLENNVLFRKLTLN
jgi:regulator of cell morphogenesis and NO signaling